MITASSSLGVRTGSAGATPYLGAAWSPPLPTSPPPRTNAARRAVHLRVAAGGGCAASNSRCACWIAAATSVDTRSKRLGA
eukprot:263765-Pleurochrysis_carterae.AAC.1